MIYRCTKCGNTTYDAVAICYLCKAAPGRWKAMEYQKGRHQSSVACPADCVYCVMDLWVNLGEQPVLADSEWIAD